MIKLIKQKLKEYKKDKTINELNNININKFFEIKNFYLNEALEESKNIKYKKSIIFMILYKDNFKSDKSKKSEDKILKESIQDYNEIMKEIIEKLINKSSLFKIKNIDIIVKEIIKQEFNFDEEINFINQEFNFLNKSSYILNNLKSDFTLFLEKYQFVELIRGIINFININFQKNALNDTRCFANLRTIYNSIIQNKISHENINELIDLLKSNEYYINSENIIIKFYKYLLEKKESLSFLKILEETIINNKEISFFNSKDINDLIDIYIFFKKIFSNKEIKTDKNFLYIYNKEMQNNNNNFKKNLDELYIKYINFIKNGEIDNNKIIKSDNNKNQPIQDNNFNKFEIIFNYNSIIIKIQSNLNEKMKDIINKFIIKTKEDKKSLYFLYGGNIIKEESILSQIVTKDDLSRNKMNILVNSVLNNINKKEENNSIIKSREVICPKCYNHINIKIKKYKISLSRCKNNHDINDISFKDFQNTQKINLKNIVCNICNNNNKYETYNKEFYTCFTCNKNLCPLCKSNHDNKHNIFNYDKRIYICTNHFESYNSYCKNCEKNLCIKCEKEHNEHEKIYFGNILPDYNEMKLKVDEFGKYIYQLNESLDEVINRLNEYKKNINEYYNIYIDIMKNIENKDRNYEILNNMIEINNNNVMKDIKYIAKEKNINNKINIILDITNKIGLKNNDEITIIYNINKNQKSIRLFDSEFVNNNKNICKIIYDNKEIELKENINIEGKNGKLEIKLKGISKITNANKMFYECKNFESIPDFFNWDLSNVNEMNDMFKGCFNH